MDYKESVKFANNLRQFIQRKATKGNWKVNVTIGVSQYNPRLSWKEKEYTRKLGRPKTVIKNEIGGKEIKIANVPPHIHLAIKANPGATLEKQIMFHLLFL